MVRRQFVLGIWSKFGLSGQSFGVAQELQGGLIFKYRMQRT